MRTLVNVSYCTVIALTVQYNQDGTMDLLFDMNKESQMCRHVPRFFVWLMENTTKEPFFKLCLYERVVQSNI